MQKQVSNFHLQVLETEEEVGKAAADFVAAQVRQKPESVLLLPTGRTPLDMYRNLVEMVKSGNLDLHYVHTFNLDEFCGLSSDHPGSYAQYMREALFDHVAIPEDHTHILNCATPDPKAEAALYDAAMHALGGVDLAVLGIGVNGHIGFNEPGSSFSSGTRVVPIREETREANAFLFDGIIDEVPKEAMTVGIATIMESRQILLLATGESKADVVYGMIYGPVTPELPASILQKHPDVTVILDREAASKLPQVK